MYSPPIPIPIPIPSTGYTYDAITAQCGLAYGAVWAVCKSLKSGKAPHSKNEKR